MKQLSSAEPDATEIEALRQSAYNATLVSRHDLHDDLARFRIRPDAGVPPLRAGQYVALGLGYWEPRVQPSQAEQLKDSQRRKVVRRAYSISCPMIDDDGHLASCEDLDYLEFYVTLVRQAEQPPALTPRLFALEPGMRLAIQRRVVGNYVLDGVAPDDTVLLLATGTGEAPHNAMAASLLRQGHRGRIINATCVRRRADLGYTETHAELMRRFDNYRYLAYTTREPENLDPDHPGYVGKQHLQDLYHSGLLAEAAGVPLDPQSTHVYLCGNPEMIGYQPPGGAPLSRPGMLQSLVHHGFRDSGTPGPGLVRFEKYW